MKQVQRPDVVLIVLDATRTFDVSAVWPHGPSTTPFLEELAGQSLVFPEATTPSPWTLPGHASLFTGLLPAGHGATEVSLRLGEAPPTLAGILGSEGYSRVAVVCNELIGTDTGLDRGFQLVVREADALPPHLDGGPVDRLRRRSAVLRRVADARHRWRRMAHDHGGARANRLVQRVLRTAAPEQPLFLFVNYLETHLPYRPPDVFAQRYLPAGASLARARAVNQSTLDHAIGTVVHDDQEWACLRGLYRASIAYVDQLVRSMLADLRDARGLENTVVIVTSDHGENIGDHGLMDHQCSLHESVLRVPLIVRLPGGELQGVRPGLASLTDILPTVAEIVGITPPATEGHTLTQAVTRSHVIAEYLASPAWIARAQEAPEGVRKIVGRDLRSVRSRTHKYIWASDGQHEFYDLEADPFENRNLTGTHPDEPELVAVLRRWEERTRAVAVPATDPAALVERLRRLGYVS